MNEHGFYSLQSQYNEHPTDGDSGGPLLYNKKILGTLIATTVDSNNTHQYLYSKVSTHNFKNWLQQQLQYVSQIEGVCCECQREIFDITSNNRISSDKKWLLKLGNENNGYCSSNVNRTDVIDKSSYYKITMCDQVARLTCAQKNNPYAKNSY